MDMGTAQTSIYVTSAMQIFTDLTCSLLPLSLLNDRRATREKVGICSMILVGLLATSAAIYKTTIVRTFDVQRKFLDVPKLNRQTMPLLTPHPVTEDMSVSVVGLSIMANLEAQLA